MNGLSAVGFSTGLAAVLLGAAAIILIVMTAEAVCMSRLQKRGKNKKSEALQQREEPPVNDVLKEPSAAVNGGGKICEQPAPARDGEPRNPVLKIKGTQDKSFSARLILSDGDTKKRYSDLKNGLLKGGFQSRICRKYESFRAAKKLAARLAFRRSGLCLFCAAVPDGFIYPADAVEDLSDKKSHKSAPLLCPVKDGGGAQTASRLIAGLTQNYGTENPGFKECDYAALLPYEDITSLIEKGLVMIKVYRKKPKAENKKIPHKTAEKPVRGSPGKSVKKGVKKAVNLDVIYKSFNGGENATWDEIKKRVFGNNENVIYIKVLGKGNADKNITVTANSFSCAARKKILAAGGKVIVKKR